MGAVFRAVDQQTNQTVAVKRVHSDTPRLRAAFEREMHLLSQLEHPALPRVSDAYAAGDADFLVMTFVPGQDLAEQLRRRREPFATPTVLDWADQLLDVLGYLHGRQPPTSTATSSLRTSSSTQPDVWSCWTSDWRKTPLQAARRACQASRCATRRSNSSGARGRSRAAICIRSRQRCTSS